MSKLSKLKEQIENLLETCNSLYEDEVGVIYEEYHDVSAIKEFLEYVKLSEELEK